MNSSCDAEGSLEPPSSESKAGDGDVSTLFTGEPGPEECDEETEAKGAEAGPSKSGSAGCPVNMSVGKKRAQL
jgi:hypothetical protein